MTHKYIYSAISAAMISISAAAAPAAPHVADGIDKYVAYDVRPAAVARPQYCKLDPEKGGSAMLTLEDDGKRVVKRDIQSGRELQTIFDVTTTRETKIAGIDGFTLSPDGSKLLVWRNKKMIYRRSYTAEYYVYEIRTRLLSPLSTAHTPQQAPLMSPDGRMVAFVDPADNNIYLRKLDYNTEVAVTTDGAKRKVINGVPDWTYEEEFTTSQSMTWSPDCLTLCYIKYNEADVPEFSFPLYGSSCDKDEERYELYPGRFSYKYPVAGEPNSRVSVHSYDIETRQTKKLDTAPDVEYIPRIAFAGASDRLAVVTLNRDQNRMEILAVNPRSMVSRSILIEKENAWIDPRCYEELSLSDDSFVVFSTRTGYSHLYQYSYSGQQLRALTSGDYDVTAYLGYDPSTRRHFYQSASPSPYCRTISSVDDKGRVKALTPERGSASGWLSPDGAYLTVSYSSFDTAPTYTLYATRSDKSVRTIEDNSSYAAAYTAAPRPEIFEFTTDQGVKLYGMMVKPAGFNPTSKYPVVMHQYSGPGSQEVLDRWTMGWMNYYAERGYVVVTVDGRGTGGRGRAFQDIVYKNLGHYETIDQSAAARYIASQPWAGKVGIFGWSYGGYEALMSATTGSFGYDAAVAVAPVTDWRFYDTVYAERYMLTPAQNPEGYRQSAPLTHAASLQCPTLIMHGTADDNVHFSNTVEFVSAAETSGTWVDMLIFPNMNHSIYGCNSRQVVYSRMLDYFDRYLKN